MITVRTAAEYRILTGDGLLSETGALLRGVMPDARRAAVVADSNVAPLYFGLVRASLEAAGFKVTLVLIEAGEKSKTWETVGGLLERFAAAGLTRKDAVAALGGGVTGDLAGFAAAVYLRGVGYIQLPTTLLAQIDSSVGGKTGCDLQAGKNLAGAFWQPRLVLIDPLALRTLPERVFRDGAAEALKYGCIFSAGLFSRLAGEPLTPQSADLREVIETCVKLKAGVVERDEKESGERMLLNFGHTAGHALEKYYGYETLTHGEAVGAGMALVTRASEAAKLTKPGTADQIVRALGLYGLPADDPAPLPGIVDGALYDKKRAGGAVSLVLLREIGESFVQPVEISRLEGFLKGEGF